ncbi:hypothetical protein [Sporichthya sp.]|uniref:hypothetical protein n=1 Tax=Sporichthya sp. TaxID=65475 RepID=UPI0018210745|nr:hypothetical protein [Sporichthya sp.]MBA3743697.1 hypothetical protein [Sporichthya sp.]
MLRFRAVRRLRGTGEAEAVGALPVEDVVETPLVPCNDLRAHWVKTAEGNLELRWELDGADARTRAA